jgi:succinate dehydrogenase / fumarate reductase cytochrome b subunit
MRIIENLFNSSLGKKYIMAVTGFALFFFVLGHLVGNLQIFLGPEAINRYGHFLQSNPEIIWPARIGLLICVGLHIWSAIKISAENKAARPQSYAVYKPVASSYASRTMLMSGLIILAFIIYHLLHYTVMLQAINGTGHSFVPLEDPEKRHDIFKMMVMGFSVPWVSLFYIIAMALLCLHLSHGVSSMFQSIGWKNAAYRGFLDKLAYWLAALIFIGYASIPIAIMAGYGKEALLK